MLFASGFLLSYFPVGRNFRRWLGARCCIIERYHGARWGFLGVCARAVFYLFILFDIDCRQKCRVRERIMDLSSTTIGPGDLPRGRFLEHSSLRHPRRGRLRPYGVAGSRVTQLLQLRLIKRLACEIVGHASASFM